jgi:asparagine synthase (glutamine-hydrolysing)
MQDGAGISQLVNIFNNIISNESFNDQIKLIKKTDDVSIRSKESLHYYLIYRKYYDIPKNLHTSNSVCKYCHYEVLNDAHFCKMCGAFPI